MKTRGGRVFISFFPICSADVGNRKSRPSFGNVVSGEESVEGLRSGAVEAELGSPELGHRLGVQHHQTGVVDVWLTPASQKQRLGFESLPPLSDIS